jgi:hypothetical protein
MAFESLNKIAPALFSPEQDLIEVYNKKTGTVGVINPSYIKSSPSGSAGAIQFSDGSAFSSDSSNLFWDDTNKRLGIGTNAPLGILHLYKSAAPTRLAIDGDAGQNRLISYRTGGLQRFGLYVNNTAESGSNAGSNFAIRAYSDAGTLLSTPLFIERSTGNVGINTTAPTEKLNIVDVDNTYSLKVSGASGSLRVKGYLSATYGTLLESKINAGTLMPMTFSASKILLLDGGVSINTTSNVAQLQIKGSGSTSATTSLFVQNSSGTELFGVRDDGNFNLAQGRLNWNGIGFGSYIQSDGYDMVYNTRQDSKIHIFCVGGNPVLGINRYSATDYRVYMGIGSGNESSAILQANSTTQGFLPPRMTTAEKNAIVTPAIGLMVFDTNLGRPCFYNGAWVTL